MQSHKNHNQKYELVDVMQALLMMGLDTLFREVPATPFVEDRLNGHIDALVQLLHTVRRAQRSAHYAYDWAVRLHDLHAEEVRVSALLFHTTEMLMWSLNPAQMLEIRKLQAADFSQVSSPVILIPAGFWCGEFNGIPLPMRIVRVLQGRLNTGK